MSQQIQFDTDTGQLGLRISVLNELDGRTTDLVFNQPAIRIGRNHLNDMVLNHAYVSQWHAVLGFVQGTLRIMQVGSSNSVLVNDQKLAPNQEMIITGSEAIRIIPFRLQIHVAPLAPEVLRAPLPSNGLASETVFRGEHPEEFWNKTDDPGMEPLALAAAPDDPAMGKIALQVLEHIAERFWGRPLIDVPDVRALGARLEPTLEVFCRCFVALQKGQQQFHQAMDIQVLGKHDHPVERATNATDLASALLAPSQPKAIQVLENAFKNIMIHQVAMLNGLMAGVRTLMAKLSPDAVTREAAKEHLLLSARSLWETYQRIHSDLAEEDNETFETIFGPQFGKAYLALLRGES